MHEGDFIIIFGPNGAGKTTFLKIAAMLTAPTEGSIFFRGKNIRDAGSSARSEVGFITHSTFLYKNLTARENLQFYGRMYRLKNLDEQIGAKLEAVGLLERADDPVQNFSRGMLQRLTIARAFLHNPFILLLDEPYTGLDRTASEILNKLLRSFIADRRAGLMTTHNIDQGYDIATHAAVLHKGQIQFFSNTKNITKEEFTAKYSEIVGGR